ncbi:MAG: peptidase M24 family protein [Actinomycetales bacterium mxb001]|nr:MAG: peptidase M24 family protein [Actinomycetales bacterium mxb001]
MLDADYATRITAASSAAHGVGLDALLITPGPDLRYLLGYDAIPLERLTCLVVRSAGDPVLVVPALELAAAKASPAGPLGISIATWQETDDPYALVASLLGRVHAVGLADHMWASKVLALRAAMPDVEQQTAGRVVNAMRMRKSPAEVSALQGAADAIDRVHAAVPSLLREGRTEREIGRDIAELIVAEGHVRADFVIVASGPNGASPHHEVSDRRLEHGDAVVVDIGGTTPEGYCSDETRTYALGDPGADYLDAYAQLLAAQMAATASVRPGVPCESVDAVARDWLEGAGLGDFFIHRTGHGIGLETHEEPYIVAGNDLPLEEGMAFSVEPGYYIPGRFGARIEDIVVCGSDGPVVLNQRPRDLVVVEP